MKKFLAFLIAILGFLNYTNAQFKSYKFGDGIKVTAEDSTFYMRFGFRFQNLATAAWEDTDAETDFSSNFLVRRSRLKFDGFAYTPKLKYKLELGLSNRDIGGGTGSEFNRASNVILDAFVRWNFAKNWVLQFGQAKLPGNRERVVSSGNLQLVDRSRLNSRYNIDRDVGLQLRNDFTLGQNFVVKEIVAFSQGEGRNVTGGHFGGFSYTFRLELLPFGTFMSNGDYIGSAIKREPKPKLSIGLTYDINKNSVRERGRLGRFITDEFGNHVGKDVQAFFADFVFKYQGWCITGEFADKGTKDGIPTVLDINNNVIGTFYHGSALALQAGYMFDSNVEIVLRYTGMNPDELVANDEVRWTLGLNKFIVGHKLKLQTDLTSINVDGGSNEIVWRTQMDVHF